MRVIPRGFLHLTCVAAASMFAAPILLFPLNFNSPRAYAVTGLAYGVTTGDFNGDGKTDVAVAGFPGIFPNGNPNVYIQIFLGDGKGGFQSRATYQAGTGTSAFANCLIAGDFNNDGFLDLAVATGTQVSILIGQGDGTFLPAVNYPAGSFPSSIASADFNRDGSLDLAVVNNSSNNVSVLLGNGDGTFKPAVDYAAGTEPEGVAAGDFNQDGNPDLAVVNYNYSGTGSFSILYGLGNGTFKPAVNYSVAQHPQSIAVGDFNRDGHMDLAITHWQGQVSVVLGAAGGGFQPPVLYNAGTDPGGVVVRDINVDGNLDLAVTNQYDITLEAGAYAVSILKGNGDGTFQAPSTYLVASGPESIAFGDFNGDGRPDLAVACDAGGFTALLHLVGGGFEQFVNFSAGASPYAIAAGDFNGDGKPDLAVANYVSSGTISILIGNGDGTFRPPVAYDAGGAFPASVVVGDFNRDGRLDLAVASTTVIAVLLGNGDGTFAAPIISSVSVQGALAAADFNGDGHLDLASTYTYGFLIMLGNGDGTFQAPAMYGVETFADSLALGDFNNDGHPDLAVQAQSCADEYCFDQTVIYLGDAAGTFTYNSSAGVGYFPPAEGDFNGDGNADLVAAGDGDAWVALGNGTGSLGTASAYPSTGIHTAIADFNHDGKPDLAMASAGDTVAFLTGNGDGTFQPQQQFITGGCTNALALADFNGDGKPDVATANQCAGTVTILTNTTGHP